MKNWEFYEDQIKNNPAFAIVGGEVVECIPLNCPKCIFSIRCCDERIRFLYQEHKEPVVLTDDEKHCASYLVEVGLQRMRINRCGGLKKNRRSKKRNGLKEKEQDGHCV